MEVQRYARDGRDVILIGHAGHPEVEGTMGRFDTLASAARIHLVRASRDVAALCRCAIPRSSPSSPRRRCRWTTPPRSSTALRARFPRSQTPRKEDICYATQNRQDAVKKLLEQCDVLLVVGSRTSSNSNRLRELADRAGSSRLPGRRAGGPAARVVRRQAARSA